MALLYRFAQVPDRHGTRVFSFVVTKSAMRKAEGSVITKDLMCGFQKWAVAFSRTDKVLGAYLVWRTHSRNVRVFVDFSFTLLNREHFSMNEDFAGKRVKFTFDTPAQGNRNYIPLADLYSRNFADPNGEFQLELSMANVRTIYMTELKMNPSSVFPAGQSKPNKFETDCFEFGGFDWNLVIYPYGKKDSEDSRGQENRVSVYLIRQTDFEHRCRVRYSVSLGEGEQKIHSGQLEDLCDVGEDGYGWHPGVRWSDVARRGVVRVTLELIEARTICEVALQGLGSSEPPAASCYDRDKQGWIIQADMHSDTVRLHLVYEDINNVAPNHLRYVSWSAYLLRGEGQETVAISLPGAPYSRYYAKEMIDDGIIMETNLNMNMNEMNSISPFLTSKGELRVRLEWHESHSLFQATYHKYDDVCRIHNQQMRREIASLQTENYNLERQVFTCQKSLAYAQAQQEQQQQQQQQQQQHQPPAQPEHHEGPLERSTSTDTVYA